MNSQRLTPIAGSIYTSIAAIVVALVIGLVTYVLWGSGLFLTVAHEFDGQCRRVGGVVAGEDIVLHRDWQMAYLSSFTTRRSGIYAFDLNDPDAVPVNLLPEDFGEFRSLGLSLWRNPNGSDRLFVVNRVPEPRIEIFELVGPLTLRHIQTVRSTLIRYPNDVAAVGFDQFYVTNTHRGEPGSWLRAAETYLRLQTGDVTFFDGERARVVVDGVGYANGIAASNDGTQVYVASTATSEVFRFDRDEQNELVLKDRTATPGRADNIAVSPDSTITVALHPKALDAAGYMGGGDGIAPTRIAQIHFDPPRVDIIYDDPGTELSAGATGVLVGNRLLIGPVRADYFLDCRANMGFYEFAVITAITRSS
ncbi:MAG: SMP-30/gluconolactonase/LRE family protein [Pseudomonadota bacterium]